MKVLVRRKRASKAEKVQKCCDLKALPEKYCDKPCVWSVAVGRILELLCIAVFLYVFFLSLVAALLMSFDNTLGAWKWTVTAIQGHPVWAVVLLVAGFLVFLFSFTSLVGRRLSRDHTKKEKRA